MNEEMSALKKEPNMGNCWQATG